MAKEIEKIFQSRTPWVYLTALFGIAAIMFYWFPFEPFKGINSEVMAMTAVVSFFMFALGAISQYLMHLPVISQKKQGWQWSAFFLGELTLFLLIVIGTGTKSDFTTWIVNYLRTPIALGVSTLYGPFIYRAVLKSVHAKNISVAVMLLVMLLVWMGYAPIFYSNIPGLYELGDFLQNRLASGSAHAFELIIALVSAITCIRLLLGREKGYLGR